MGDITRLFTEENIVGTEDQEQGEWTLVMYRWRAYARSRVKEHLDAMAGGAAMEAFQSVIHKSPAEAIIRACAEKAPKARKVSNSPDHRVASFSLLAPLKALGFPRLGDRYRAVFHCRPIEENGVKYLVIDVANYKVELIEKQSAAASRQSESPAPKTEA